MKILKLLFVLAVPSIPGGLMAQETDTLPELLEQIVVTASRTEKQLADIPLPVSMIGSREIAQAGMMRLSDVLAEQTGLALISDHGTGLQMQGFSPDYTLILLDGQPLIGRTTGTLELSRVAVGNIDRVEIVKGPSSSLYGSEALAGVVNIITKMPQEGSAASFSGRYGTNRTADLGVSFQHRKNKLGVYGFANRYSSGGYRLAGSSLGPTVPPFFAHTFHLKGDYAIGNATSLTVSGRYFDEQQESYYLIEEEQGGRIVDEEGRGKDFNLSASLRHRFSERTEATLRLYHTGYETHSDIIYRESGDPYDASYFDQRFLRPEIQLNHSLGVHTRLTAGAGWGNESVTATRYAEKKVFRSGYAYFQAEWDPLERVNLMIGGRLDTHSEYRSQFSPRISGQYRLTPDLQVYVSFGRGYKAPDFRQLYLNFTNPVAGYSVFGINELEARLKELEASGQIAAYLVDPSTIRTIDAESSLAYNAGIRYAPFPVLKISANLFRNDVEHLIESAPVATKTNGQSVFSYFNLNKVLTQGLELSADYELSAGLQVRAGYQYLQAYDKDVLSRLEAGEIYRRDASTGITERVPEKDYAGLSNRSRHMANLKLDYDHSRYGFHISLRAIYRGRYGFGDFNGNGIVDAANEYVPSYTVLNLTCSKRLLQQKLVLQLEAENLLGYTDPAHVPTLPGRLFYAGLSYRIGNGH